LFRRTYTIKIIAELSALALFAGLFICYHQRFNIDRLLFLTIVLDLFKTFLIAFFTKLSYKALVFSVKPDLLKKSFSFFLLLFTSLLGSRADQINASLLLNTTEIGSYQILMNFVLILQASSNFILQPFLKNIYRLKFVLIQKIALRLFLIGIPLAAFGVLLIHVTLFYIYQIEFDPLILLLGYLFVLPMFHYSPYIYYLFKLDKIKPVILFNIGGSLVLFSISILLFHFYKSGIFSLLLSATLVQWMLLFIYKFYTARQAFREEGEMAQA
jgi:O-antigen/teichoic acid export membrane protein